MTKTTTAWETVIGLEIHAELLTDAKIWCGCSTRFGQEQNTNVCPICMGLPGTLPVLNEKAVEYTIRAGLALGCEIPSFSKFDRKNYFYPDLPKAHQVSQHDQPFCIQGKVEFEVDGKKHTVGINRVHLEEEAGKSVHSGDNILGSDFTLVDYNRAGVPLIEIVSEPDLRSPEAARVFLENLRAILQYTGVSDCKMEEGSLRCDANISLRPRGAKEFGAKAEVKNMNSFRAVQRALEYEVLRQQEVLESGGEVLEETRHWDETQGRTVSMRTKEESDDYRFFPDPDLVPVVVQSEWVETIRADLPELPGAKRERFMQEYELPAYDASVLTTEQSLADYFEATVAQFDEPKTVSNWIMGEVLRLLNETGRTSHDIPVQPKALAELLAFVKKGTIGANVGKEVLEEMFTSGKQAAEIVKEKGLEQISDAGELQGIVAEVIAEHPGPVEQYLDGKDTVIKFLVGQVMRKTRGQANPGVANEMLEAALKELR